MFKKSDWQIKKDVVILLRCYRSLDCKEKIYFIAGVSLDYSKDEKVKEYFFVKIKKILELENEKNIKKT